MIKNNEELVETKEKRVVSNTYTCDVCGVEIGTVFTDETDRVKGDLFYEAEISNYEYGPSIMDVSHACSSKCLQSILDDFIKDAERGYDVDFGVTVEWTHKEQ